MLTMFRKSEKMKGGFSLPEVMLSIVVLLVGILPVFMAMSGGMTNSIGNENVIIASELAQEGTELVQNVRDNDFACIASGTCNASDAGFLKFPGSDQRDCRLGISDARVFSYAAADLGQNIDCSNTMGNQDFDLTIRTNGSYPNFYAHYNDAGKFKRRLLLDKDFSGAVHKFTVYSLVTWGGSTWAAGNTLATAIANLPSCTIPNHCIYAQSELWAWKK